MSSTIRTIDLRGQKLNTTELLAVVPRASFSLESAHEQASSLIADVRDRGSAALNEQTEKFDRVVSQNIRVSAEAIAVARQELAPDVEAALLEAIRRVRLASANQVPSPVRTEFSAGAVIEQRWQPVSRAGVYIPGGKAVYPSSVVMNVVAAQAAGVHSIALASPAQADFDGLPHPTVLAAAALLGITEVYAMGGAGAIAALAYGVPELDLQPVSVITGPGNIFVAAAKRIVSARVGIDAEAGPTEILIIADSAANPDIIAADLLSQAEHDELAAAVLITDSAELLGKVAQKLEQQRLKTQNQERASAALGGEQSALILVDSLDLAVEMSNIYAPEHLSVFTADNESLLPRLVNAGAIFVGEYAPVSVGDYLAGSNHVLPTGGQARYRSGLAATTFLRPQQLVRYTREGLSEVAQHTVNLARTEQLHAHADAIRIRFE